jgi:CheY-like chemotaxis protein
MSSIYFEKIMRWKLDNILLVDDDDISNHLHCEIISKLEIAREVVCQRNGRDAIEYIARQYYTFKSLPSLILLDLKMPIMDGFDFINEIKKSDLLTVNRIPIAILTTSDNEEDKRRIQQLGDFFYLTKPLTEEKIWQIIDREPLDLQG